MYQKRLFFTVVLLAAGVLTRPTVAAPSVKKLGTTNNTVGTIQNNRMALTKLSTTNNRAPSVRALGATTKSTTKATTNTTNTGDSARLPGLHGNLLKGLSSKLSSNYTAPASETDTSDLMQRVTDLEAEMATKQGILESGDGIIIDGTTISLSNEITNLPEKLEDIEKDIDDLNEKIEAAGLSDEYYTKEQVDSIISQLSDMNIVDTFVEEDFLQLVQGHTPKGQP